MLSSTLCFPIVSLLYPLEHHLILLNFSIVAGNLLFTGILLSHNIRFMVAQFIVREIELSW